MTTIRKSLCIKCHKGKPFSKWALYCDKCRKELSPHQEPVATQKEEKKCCNLCVDLSDFEVNCSNRKCHCHTQEPMEEKKECNACKASIGMEYGVCSAHKVNIYSTQEPMEWNETLEDEFIAFWDSKAISLNLGRYSSDITQFWLNKIKQAEERGFQKGKDFERDMTNNGYIPTAIEMERERIIKILQDITNYNKDKEDIINLITNQ